MEIFKKSAHSATENKARNNIMQIYWSTKQKQRIPHCR
jgi:hypothetical protein